MSINLLNHSRLGDEAAHQGPVAPRTGAAHALAIGRLLAMLLPYKWQVLCAFFGLAAIASTEPAFAWIVKQTIDTGFTGKQGSHMWYLVPGSLCALFAVRGIAAFYSGYAMIWVSSNVLVNLQKEIMASLLSAQEGSQRSAVGKVVNAIVAEGRNATELIERVIIKFFRSAFSVVALYIYLFQINWRMAAVSMLFLLPFYLVCRSTGKKYEAAACAYVHANSRLAAQTEEAIHALSLIQSYGMAEHEAHRFDALCATVNRSFRRMMSLAGLMVPSTQFVAAFLIAFLLLARPWLDAVLTPGEYVAFAANLLLMLVPLRDLAEVNGAMLRGLVAAFTLFSVVDRPRERESGEDLSRTGPGDIELREVSLEFSESACVALDQVSLTLRENQSLAILGRSGAGKSSLLNIVAHLRSPSSGTVLVGGKRLDQLDLAHFRGKIAMVEQDCLLFEGTISMNVCYGDPNPDHERIRAALHLAQLDNYVAGLPEGCETCVGRNGRRLSGGQRQLVSIARAFYKDCPILILDEPTASLDTLSEQRVKSALRRLLVGRTTIIVTHRPAILDLVDRYVILDKGRVSACGDVADLLQLTASARNACFSSAAIPA